jgi:branched-subunit amino acid ABC-type transport system permease component
MAGAAGVLLGSLFFASFNMGFVTGIKAFVAATLGGLGSLTGAMLGGLAFGLIFDGLQRRGRHGAFDCDPVACAFRHLCPRWTPDLT